MSTRLLTTPPASHRVLPEKSSGQLRANLRKAESEDSLKELGECLGFARRYVGWSLKELAAALNRDERQIARWERGEEKLSIVAVFAVPKMRQPFVVALAKLASCDVDITVRMSA